MSARVTWPDVLRAVQGDENRSAVTTALRGGGFDADSFARLIEPRRLVCEALVRVEDRVEDRLEAKAGRLNAEERDRTRAVRRRLELELWP